MVTASPPDARDVGLHAPAPPTWPHAWQVSLLAVEQRQHAALEAADRLE